MVSYSKRVPGECTSIIDREEIDKIKTQVILKEKHGNGMRDDSR